MIVLGGGLAGLSASMVTGAPVYEAEPQVGGTSRSKVVQGFTFDYGIHVLQSSDAIVHDVFRAAGVTLGTHHRNAYIYSHGVYTAYPFQVNTAGLPLRLRARCIWHYFTRDRSAHHSNYEEWILGTVGKGFGHTFLIPYSEKFWTLHPREMTADWTDTRIPQVHALQVLRGALISRQTHVGSNPVFQYPDQGEGYGAIPERIGGLLGSVYLNHRATCVDVDRRCVEFNGGQVVVPFDTLISTIPLPVLVSLIPQVPAEVRQDAASLRCNSIFVINLGIDRPNVSDWTWAHYPDREVSFFRISYPANLGPGLVPEGRSSVTAEIAYSDQSPIDKDTVVERVIEDLIRVRAISRTDPIIVRDTMDIPFGYVIYDHRRRGAVRRIHTWLRNMGIYVAGRYGRWEYQWSHEAILDGRRVAEELSVPVD